jgi:polyisoprenoid-binding protein YceI
VGKIRQHRKGLIAGLVLVLAVLAVGIPWAYIHLVEGDQPAPLSVDSVPTPSGASGGATGGTTGGTTGAAEGVTDLDGAWVVGSGSQAGYRVHETLAGQSTTAVGRTSAVTGSVTVSGDRVSTGSISVDIGSIASDRSARDQQFTGRIMDAARFPTAVFTLTEPVDLGSVPPVGATVTADVTGDLTLHGVTKPVTFPGTVKRSAGTVAVAGTIPVRYADYQIDNPSVGGFVSVGDSGTVEFLLVLRSR